MEIEIGWLSRPTGFVRIRPNVRHIIVVNWHISNQAVKIPTTAFKPKLGLIQPYFANSQKKMPVAADGVNIIRFLNLFHNRNQTVIPAEPAPVRACFGRDCRNPSAKDGN
jgi:hypothetical protein